MACLDPRWQFPPTSIIHRQSPGWVANRGDPRAASHMVTKFEESFPPLPLSHQSLSPVTSHPTLSTSPSAACHEPVIPSSKVPPTDRRRKKGFSRRMP